MARSRLRRRWICECGRVYLTYWGMVICGHRAEAHS